MYEPQDRLLIELLFGDDPVAIEEIKKEFDLSRKVDLSKCLIAAIEKGNSKIVPWLLEHGLFHRCFRYLVQNLDASEQIYSDPIEHAILNREFAIAELLIDSNKFNITMSILRLATMLGYVDIVKQLLEKGSFTTIEFSTLTQIILSSIVVYEEGILRPFLANLNFDPLPLIPVLAKYKDDEGVIALILFERPDLAAAVKKQFPHVYASQRELSMGLIDRPNVSLDQPAATYSPRFDSMINNFNRMLQEITTTENDKQRRVLTIPFV